MLIRNFRPSISEIIPYIKEAIFLGKTVKITVTGFSMYPLLRGGTDCVTLAKPNKIKKYDVVLFQREGGEYIFHRVIKEKNGILTIAGDNENKKEFPVYSKDIIAVMKSFERDGNVHNPSELWYRIYVRLWLLIFPLRKVAVRIFNRLAKMQRKIRHRR